MLKKDNFEFDLLWGIPLFVNKKGYNVLNEYLYLKIKLIHHIEYLRFATKQI